MYNDPITYFPNVRELPEAVKTDALILLALHHLQSKE
jgi:hypothetical protein